MVIIFLEFVLISGIVALEFMAINTNLDWAAYSWLKRGSRRAKVLKLLSRASDPLTATEVKKAQKVDITQAAFTLAELRGKGLVRCLNPKDHHGKLFVITKKGKVMVKRLAP